MQQVRVSGRRPRVLLVFSTPIKADAFFGYLLPPLGLECIASAIYDIAEVRLLDLRFDADWPAIARSFDPDVIGINVKTTLYASKSYFVADRLRAALPRATVVLGGLHASGMPEEALQHGHIVAVGEGEETMREIVDGRPWLTIPGIVFRDENGVMVTNPPRPHIQDLDLLPPPARHLRPAHYRYAAAGLIPMDLLETSRGCTQYCPFCSPAALHHGTWRAHSPEYVLAEARRLYDAGVRYVMLTDDHFTGDLDRAKKIAELISEAGIRMAMFCFLRPFLGRMDVKLAMVKAGFVLLSYGAESPNPAQLRRYGKGFDDAGSFIRQVNREWHEAGARYIGNSYVFGDPLEAAEDLTRLGDYARELDPTYIEPLYSQPYPGTRYREDLAKRGLLLEQRGWDLFTEGRLLVRHPVLNEDQIRDQRVRMWLRFFSPRKLVGAFRVPLYLHDVVGIPLRTVLKYMKACEYCVFGCVLEDKFYGYRRRSMVREYIRHHINSFPLEERDMTPFTDEFLGMLGIRPFLRLLRERVIHIDVVESSRPLTRFSASFADGHLKSLHAGPCDAGSVPATLRIRLEDVVSLVCGKDLEKLAALVRMFVSSLVHSLF